MGGRRCPKGPTDVGEQWREQGENTPEQNWEYFRERGELAQAGRWLGVESGSSVPREAPNEAEEALWEAGAFPRAHIESVWHLIQLLR